MNRGIVSLPVLLSAVLSAFPVYAATLSGSEATAAGPSPVTIVVSLTSAVGEAVAGIQCEVAFDPQMLTLQGMEAGVAATDAGKLLSTNAIAAGRHRVIIAGLNQTAIADGPVLQVSVSPSAGTADGRHEVRIENVVMSDPAGQRVNATATPGVVIVGDGGGLPPPPPPPAGCGCAEGGGKQAAGMGDAGVAAMLAAIVWASSRRGRAQEAAPPKRNVLPPLP